MRHFEQLSEADRERLFEVAPAEVDPDSRSLAAALGATLYTPANRPDLVGDLRRARSSGVLSSVLCLEDAIAEQHVPSAERATIAALAEVAHDPSQAPVTFVRVRSADQLERIAAGLGADHAALAGFVLPKFDASRGLELLRAGARASETVGRRLWMMPVLETAAVIHRESRLDELMAIRDTLLEWRESVLAVRVGATDLSAVYGLRRPRGLTAYDVVVVASALGDIVNLFARAGDDGFVVSGPVWEYFSASERLFKPLLRETPFDIHRERDLRTGLVQADLDGLIREVVLDQANGMRGKTVIHPSHVAVVHALSVVTHEEYLDAVDVMKAAQEGAGVRPSGYQNKMNEALPHRAWARSTLERAAAFGVSRPEVSFVDLLSASRAVLSRDRG